MSLPYLVLFLMSIMLNAYAFETIIMRYDDLDYESIKVYDLTKDRREQCYCYEY